MTNPFLEIAARLDSIDAALRTLRTRTEVRAQQDLGGLELAVEVTGYQPRTIYKKVHLKEIPHMKRGGRLFFSRTQLEQWISDGRKKTIQEQAAEVMSGNNNAR